MAFLFGYRVPSVAVDVGVSGRWPSDSMPSSSYLRLPDGRMALVIDPRWVAKRAEAFARFAEVLAEVDDDEADARHFGTVVEQIWQAHLSPGSSPSTPPVPHPEARERDRIGTTDAAAILGRTPRAVRKMCIERRLPGARQDGPRGEWSVPRVVVEQVAGVGSGCPGRRPDPGAGGGSDGLGMGPSDPGGA